MPHLNFPEKMRQTLCLLLISVIPIALAEPGLADLGDKCNEESMVCQLGQICSPDTHECIEDSNYVAKGEICEGKTCKDDLVCAKTKSEEPAVCQHPNKPGLVGLGVKCDGKILICSGRNLCSPDEHVCIVNPNLAGKGESCQVKKCQDAYACVKPQEGGPAVCQDPKEKKVVGSGQTCNHVDTICSSNLTCREGVCISFTYIKIGEPCGTRSTSFCEKGSICTYSPDGFKCKSSIPNIVIAKESESCEHPDLKCDDGLLCLKNGLVSSKGTCQKPKISKKGETCDEIQSQCDSKLYCKRGKLRKGICTEKMYVKEGEECNLSDGKFCEEHLDCAKRKQDSDSPGPRRRFGPTFCVPAIIVGEDVPCGERKDFCDSGFEDCSGQIPRCEEGLICQKDAERGMALREKTATGTRILGRDREGYCKKVDI